MMPGRKFAAQQGEAVRLAPHHGGRAASRRMAAVATRLAVLGTVGLLLAGCASTFDVLPHVAGGLPAEAPARPAEQGAYPDVHNMPPDRRRPVLSDVEKKQAEADLVAIRDKQQRASAALVKQDQDSADDTSTTTTPAKPAAKPSKKNARPADPAAGTGRNP